MWFDGENVSLNAEFPWNTNLVKGMSISAQNYKIMAFSNLFI